MQSILRRKTLTTQCRVRFIVEAIRVMKVPLFHFCKRYWHFGVLFKYFNIKLASYGEIQLKYKKLVLAYRYIKYKEI